MYIKIEVYGASAPQKGFFSGIGKKEDEGGDEWSILRVFERGGGRNISPPPSLTNSSSGGSPVFLLFFSALHF